MNKSELLARIRGLQKELDGLMDMIIAIEDSQPEQPLQIQPENDNWLTVRQVCKYLNISQTTFYEGIRNGIFPKGFAFGAKTIRGEFQTSGHGRYLNRHIKIQLNQPRNEADLHGS